MGLFSVSVHRAVPLMGSIARMTRSLPPTKIVLQRGSTGVHAIS